jgi:hypothetical protein
MLHSVKKIEYLDKYTLKLTFNDKKTKTVNLNKYKTKDKNSVFYSFNDLDFFKSVKLDKKLGTLVWPNGIDLCPDALYMLGKDI